MPKKSTHRRNGKRSEGNETEEKQKKDAEAGQRRIDDFFGVQRPEEVDEEGADVTGADAVDEQGVDVTGGDAVDEQQWEDTPSDEDEQGREESDEDVVAAKSKTVTKAAKCNYCTLKRVSCTGGEQCERCRKDHVVCDYSLPTTEQSVFVKRTGNGRKGSKAQSGEQILFFQLPPNTDFPPMSAWVAAETRRTTETMLSSSEAFALIYHSYVLRQAVPRGRVKLLIGLKSAPGACTSKLPLIVQGWEWSSAEVTAYQSWKPSSCLLASNALVPCRDDDFNTEVLTLRFLVPDLRSLDARPYAGHISRITFQTYDTIKETQTDETLLVVMYLEGKFLFTTMPDLLDRRLKIDKTTIKQLNGRRNSPLMRGPCWYAQQRKDGVRVFNWFYQHGSEECKQWARARTVGAGEGDIGGLNECLMSEFLSDESQRRTKRMGEVFRQYVLDRPQVQSK